jgi:hypothetical protein
MRIIPTLVFVFALLAGNSFADEPMTKVVFRPDMPGLSPTAPGAQPKTLYRWQLTKGRVEESLDQDHHVQPLFIADGKDGWFIDEVTKTGKHMIDPSTDHNFYAPIIPPPSPNGSAPVRSFEIGRELDFMNSQKVSPKSTVKDGQMLQLYECVQEVYTIDLYVSPTSGMPVESDVLKDGKLVVRLIYTEYSNSLPADPKLFAPPPDVKISEG